MTDLMTAADVDSEYTVMAAAIAGAHGVGGNVRLRLIGSDAETTVRILLACTKIRLVAPDGRKTQDLTLSSLRKQAQPKGAWIAHFKEVTDRDAATALYGWAIMITENERAPLPEGQYYVDQLIGLHVEADTGVSFGQLIDVLSTPANDVYVTDLDIMIPAVPEFILSVDLTVRKIIIKDMPGLRDEA